MLCVRSESSPAPITSAPRAADGRESLVVPSERLGDRRAELRFEIVGDLWATLVATRALPVLNLGSGGMLVESTGPMAVGSVQRLRLTVGDHRSDVAASVRHVTVEQGKPDRYLVGLAFVDLPSATRQRIDAFVGTDGPATNPAAEARA
jgi:hypothetical protein